MNLLHSALNLPTRLVEDEGSLAVSMLAAMQHPMIGVDPDGLVTYLNEKAARVLGDCSIGTSLDELFPDQLVLSEQSQRAAAGRLITRDGSAFDTSVGTMAAGGLCVSLWPVLAPHVASAGDTDDLTGLVKRKAFMSALDTALAASVGTNTCVGVLCLDLDRFKMINDTLGHGVGDRLLRKVADRVRGACRRDDVVARLGGDEFVILQPVIEGMDAAERLATRLVDLLSRTYVLDGHTVNIGASIGITVATGQAQARDVLRDADLALYEAKRAGRGRFRFFEETMHAALRGRREMEIDLRRALALKQFELHYQPFLDVAADEVRGFEALLRWRHPHRGDVAPMDFIPIAEENGFIVKLGEWVIATACQQATTWPDDMVVAVNISPLQFKADTLLEVIKAALTRSGLPPHRLEIEITEGALLDNTVRVIETLHALRDLGVQISMDDFGTGYSSLSYLQKFPFNKIKIDRSFVSGTGADSQAILRAISGLGTNLGIAITAEGVETAEQLASIRDQRCTHVQGYLTGRPMPAVTIPIFLSQRIKGDAS